MQVLFGLRRSESSPEAGILLQCQPTVAACVDRVDGACGQSGPSTHFIQDIHTAINGLPEDPSCLCYLGGLPRHRTVLTPGQLPSEEGAGEQTVVDI